MAMAPYMRRYTFRILGFGLSYVGALIGAIMVMKQPWAPTGPAAWALAVLPALPVVGMIWSIFRLIAETDDEYQRFLFVKQVLIATGLTLAIATIWGFLENFGMVQDVPAYHVTVLWFAMIGVGGSIARFRA
ncbi:MAG TPA: hypothetical protein VEW04_06065 [Allosphingosinicella sp.]|nr:hypothetical protein [Allosphingosinicella sp.]